MNTIKSLRGNINLLIKTKQGYCYMRATRELIIEDVNHCHIMRVKSDFTFLNMAPSNGDMTARFLAVLLVFMCVSCCFSAIFAYSREELLLLRTNNEILDIEVRRRVDLLVKWTLNAIDFAGEVPEGVSSSNSGNIQIAPPLPSIFLANVRSLRNKTGI